jgi:hypothetical protein
MRGRSRVPDQPPPPALDKPGLSIHEPGAFTGYTLLTPLCSTTTYLLDMDGRVVHTWECDCTPALGAYLLENGHLLRPGTLGSQVFGDNPGGGGGLIQEYTWDGQRVWDFQLASAEQLPHHNVCKLPNGNVLLIQWEKKSAREALAAGRKPEFLSSSPIQPDAILEVKPTGPTTGEVVWSWHVWDHLIQDHDRTRANYGKVAEHPERIDINYSEGLMADLLSRKEEVDKLRSLGYVGGSSGSPAAVIDADWTHINTVVYNPQLDQLMLSVHGFSEIWIIDHSTTTAEAAGHIGGRYGKGGDLLYRWGNPRAYRAGAVADQQLYSQHDAHWIPPGLPGAGHVLIFNNGCRRPGGEYSSVDEIVLPADDRGQYRHRTGTAYGPDQPVWTFAMPTKTDMYSMILSSAQRLPNGNTLICAGTAGTLMEVTPAGDIVWKYTNPVTEARGAEDYAMPLAPIQILPQLLWNRLKLTLEQRNRVLDLQKETDNKLQKILNVGQNRQLEDPWSGTRHGRLSLAVQILPSPMRELLKLSPQQLKQVKQLEKELDHQLDQLLTAAQRKQLAEFRADPRLAGGHKAPPSNPSLDGRSGLANPRSLFRTSRYPPGYPGLAGKDLTPGATLE